MVITGNGKEGGKWTNSLINRSILEMFSVSSAGTSNDSVKISEASSFDGAVVAMPRRVCVEGEKREVVGLMREERGR
jgi:hypothetical protein